MRMGKAESIRITYKVLNWANSTFLKRSGLHIRWSLSLCKAPADRPAPHCDQLKIMKKHISIFILTIGLSSLSLTSNFEYESKFNLNGNWEFEKIKIGGIAKKASELNSCGHKDILRIRHKREKVSYEFDEIKIIGKQIGISSEKICVIDPVEYRYSLTHNSCPTYWIKVSNTKNRVVSISEGLAIEYEIGKSNPKEMMLSKIREIVNYGVSTPDEINLKKIAEEN